MRPFVPLDMCRFAARCGVPQAPFCTPTRDKRKTRSLVPAIGFYKSYGFRSVFIQYEWPGSGPLTSSLLQYGGTKQKGKNKEQGHSYRLPTKWANIEFAFGKHIEFPARETYRHKDRARTVTFYPSFFTGVPARRRCRSICAALRHVLDGDMLKRYMIRT